jgi:hypothetical protein
MDKLLLALFWAALLAAPRAGAQPIQTRAPLPALPASAVCPGLGTAVKPLGSLASYETLLRRQRAGEVLDLSRMARPGIAFPTGGRLSVAQGSGRFEALRGGEKMDLFVPQGAELPPGTAVVETGVPAELVLKANLLSSRGEAGSNPEFVSILTEGKTFMRVLAPREVLEAPFSKAAYEVEELRGFLASQTGEDRRKEMEGVLERPGFRDLSVSAQLQTLRRIAEGGR